jgi:hypothetical protein
MDRVRKPNVYVTMVFNGHNIQNIAYKNVYWYMITMPVLPTIGSDVSRNRQVLELCDETMLQCIWHTKWQVSIPVQHKFYYVHTHTLIRF